MKKLLALILAAMMLLALIPATALADDETSSISADTSKYPLLYTVGDSLANPNTEGLVVKFHKGSNQGVTLLWGDGTHGNENVTPPVPGNYVIVFAPRPPSTARTMRAPRPSPSAISIAARATATITRAKPPSRCMSLRRSWKALPSPSPPPTSATTLAINSRLRAWR